MNMINPFCSSRSANLFAVIAFGLLFVSAQPRLSSGLLFAKQENQQTETGNPSENNPAAQGEDPFGGVPRNRAPATNQPGATNTGGNSDAGQQRGQQTRPADQRTQPGGSATQNPGQDEEEWVPPEPEIVTLETSDKVILQCDFYAGRAGKSNVPVILLHDFDGDRSDMRFLALYLQRRFEHSVIVPDLRGHGASLRVLNVEDPIDRSKWSGAEFLTIANDIERCKKFMMARNNVGELNIELLTIVAAGQVGIPASYWANSDWSWQPVNGRKQGQDVKAICFISPVRTISGRGRRNGSLTQAMRSNLFTGENIERPLAVGLIRSAENADENDEAVAIESTLTRARRKLEKVFLLVAEPYPTSTSAAELLKKESSEPLFEDVQYFIELAILRRAESLAWQNRSKPDDSVTELPPPGGAVLPQPRNVGPAGGINGGGIRGGGGVGIGNGSGRR